MTIPPRPQGISFRGEPNQRRWRRASTALPPALYDWRRHAPKSKSGWLQFLRWTIEGSTSFAEVSDDDRLANLRGLASCLRLLREYRQQFGLPPDNGGAVHDQALVLREVTRDLYEGATPLWALEYVMQKAAEGLTGHRNVNWMLLPRKGFMCIPADLHSTTIMFDMRRGFILHKMERMERVAVRLASFASNTIGSSSSIQAKFPTCAELERARLRATVGGDGGGEDGPAIPRYENAEEMAKDILDLASGHDGLYYFCNDKQYQKSVKDSTIDSFWTVTDEERDLFSRLACLEAQRSIRAIDKLNQIPLYHPLVLTLFRILAGAGACAFWFRGSWIDMVVAGGLAVGVAAIAETNLSKHERIIFEVVTSFMVGAISGLIAITWSDHTCFGAMALAGILDILQGFRVVYAVIQIMSKFTVSGCADLVEGILFTGLIAYFLRFGQYTAASLLNKTIESAYSECTNGIDERWFILLVPLAALSWSGLFLPQHETLLNMTLHGCLVYSVNFFLDRHGKIDSQMNIFISAAAVSFSSGLVSRFSRHQSAVSSTVAGLYVLMPGTYLVTAIYNDQVDGSFFTAIVERAVCVGIGAWTGSIMCSPTLLGTTLGLANQNKSSSLMGSQENLIFRDEKSKSLQNTLLIF